MAESTWEPAESLPQTLVHEYEAGVIQEIRRDCLKTGGQIVHTLSTTPMSINVEPSSKRPRTDLDDYVSKSSGYVCMYV